LAFALDWSINEIGGENSIVLENNTVLNGQQLTDLEWVFQDSSFFNSPILTRSPPNSGDLNFMGLKLNTATTDGRKCSIMAGGNRTFASNCVDASLIDPNSVCITLYDPVCGCDGKTYGNSCQAIKFGGLTNYTPGACNEQTLARFRVVYLPEQFKVQVVNMSINAHSYSLDFGDGITIGENNSFITSEYQYDFFEPFNDYTICLTVFNQDSTQISTACETIGLRISDTKQVETLAFAVFPNPSSDIFTVQMPDATNGNLRLFDSFGHLLQNVTLNGDFEKNITVNDYPSGVYWLSLKTDEGIGRTKLIVTK
jgi:hypothetical protein